MFRIFPLSSVSNIFNAYIAHLLLHEIKINGSHTCRVSEKCRIFAGMKIQMTNKIAFGLLTFALSACPVGQLRAQRHTIHNQRIASLQVVAGDAWQSMPVVEMGEPVRIEFDDMTHDYHRYNYKIEHCEADWTVSKELFTRDYLQGFNGELTISQYEQSLNTNHLYTHYSLTVPNEQCRLTLSGNYRLTVFEDDDEDRPVLSACFMVVDSRMPVAMQVDGNTDVDIYHSRQQVSMSVGYGDVRVTDPMRQIKTVVLQNGRWDNCVVNAKPDYVSADGLQWRHCRPLIFKGGNEYHKFEMLDLDHTTLGLDSIVWDGREAHAHVMEDLPRPSYVYDETANGAFYIRNSDNIDNEYTSDYAWVHFLLKAPRQAADVYLNGAWTLDSFLPPYKMQYDEGEKAYRGAVLLKQGYYSYQYLVVRPDGSTSSVTTEGDYYQTRNRYQTLIYYRGSTDRTDLLLGYGETQVLVAEP